MDLSTLTTVVTRRDLERMGVPRSTITASINRGSMVAPAPGYFMRPGSIGPFPENRYLALARAVMTPMAAGTYVVVRWSWRELIERPDVVMARIERTINRARTLKFAR